MDEHITHLRKRLAQFKSYGYDILKERDFVLSIVGFEKKKSILEIGTGRGYMALSLAQKGFGLTTIDQDRKIQQAARSIIQHYNLGKLIRFRIMNAEHLHFDDNSFDYVLAVNFMHHAKNPIRCLEEMMRVAREKIVIVDVNKRGERILEKIHAQEGYTHKRSQIGFPKVKEIFKKAKMKVRTYRSNCQTLIVAQKG
jgi:ubiquinone/menaquinone biosynthesis C-methylase UbiE